MVTITARTKLETCLKYPSRGCLPLTTPIKQHINQLKLDEFSARQFLGLISLYVNFVKKVRRACIFLK